MQVIDDAIGNTLCATSTLSPDIREQLNGKLGADKVGCTLNSQSVQLFAVSQHLVFLKEDLCVVHFLSASLSQGCHSFACCAALQGAAELVGKRIGELCLEKNISAVSFDRGGNIYHGRVQVQLLHDL